MNKGKIKKLSVLFLCVVLLASSVYTGYSVSDNDLVTYVNEQSDDLLELSDTESHGEIDDECHRLVIPIENELEQFPSKYDPRDSGIITSVKNQNPFNLCWMYATAATVEAYVSKNYGSLFDISEFHGAIFKSALLDKYNQNDGYYYGEYNSGGSFSMAAQYFTNWNEPVYADYKWNSTIDDSLCSKNQFLSVDLEGKIKEIKNNDVNMNERFLAHKSLFNVTGMKYISNDEISIKNAVQTYGAVYARVFIGTNVSFDESNDRAMYNEDSNSDHGVVIIGWDDNFSKTNFSSEERPKHDGAWLAKNSWGTNDSYSGYYWISYEDASIKSKNVVFTVTDIQKADDSEHMLSYDLLYLSSENKSVNSKVIFTNVFYVEDYTDEYEEINKVLFYLKCLDCSYNIRIAQIDGELPNDISDLSVLASGYFSGEGYITEKLNTPYRFNSNDKCAVFLEVIPNSSDSAVYLPCEKERSLINRGESLYCIDPENGNIKWSDVIDKNDYNKSGSFCIRPILKKQSSGHFAEISNNRILDTTQDCEVQYNSDSYLFNIHTSNNVILRENRDYIKTDGKIIFKSSYLQGLKDKYTEIVLEFNNDITKTIVVNPKAKITGVSISGKYAVGETLTANLVTDLIKDDYDVDYQWQSSFDGLNWDDISNANDIQYTITTNNFLRYIRVVVTSSSKYGNVEYPSNFVSNTGKTKCIIVGDTDLDSYINIDDATGIQKYLAYLTEFNGEQVFSADFDGDGSISINDVTAIQKKLVQ